MSLRHGKNAKIYINGIDISDDVTAMPSQSSRDLTKYAVHDGSGAYRSIPGLANDSITIEAMVENTVADQLQALFSATDGYAVMVLYGQVIGDPASAINEAKLKKYVLKSIVTDANKLVADLVAEKYPFDACKVLQGKAQKTADDNGSTLDNLASSASGGIGYCQIFEVTGGAGVTLTIRHSSDNFVTDNDLLLTLGTFTGPGAARVVAAGTIKRYVRFVWSGIGTSATFAIVLSRI